MKNENEILLIRFLHTCRGEEYFKDVNISSGVKIILNIHLSLRYQQ